MILAIETSSKLCSIAFWENGETLIEFKSDIPMRHASLIGPFVERGLQKTGLSPDLVAVAIGPGSFTGLRIGLSYAQGFCFGRNIPIVGVSNHQVLATQKASDESPIYSIIDARRDEVYLAKHKIDETFEIESHQIASVKTLAEYINGPAQLIGGEDINIPGDIIVQLKEKDIELNQQGKYLAAYVASLGQKILQKKGSDNIEILEPMYIRPFAGVQ